MADDPWAKFNPQTAPDWSKFSPEEPPSSSDQSGELIHGITPAATEKIQNAMKRQDPRYEPMPDISESVPDWAKTAAGIGLSFAIPEKFGLQILANRAASMLPGAMRTAGVPLRGQAAAMKVAAPAAQIGGATAEGAVGGAAGGTLSGDKDRDITGDATTGAIAGGGLRGAGAAVEEALRVLPPQYQRTAQAVAAAAATAGLHQTGLTSWMPHWAHAAVWWTLFQENLADLAAKWAQRKSGVVGSAAAHLMPATKEQDTPNDRPDQ